MTAAASRFTLKISGRAVLYATALVAVAGLLLSGVIAIFDPRVASASYLAMMFLLSPARSGRAPACAVAGAWAVIVAISGFLIGSHGIWMVLLGLVAVCIVQGTSFFGHLAAITRSPVNFVVFAGFADTGVQLWQVVVGSVIGAAFMVLTAFLVPSHARDSELPQRSRRDGIADSATLAAGSVTIVVLASLLDFPFVNWAMLSFCMIVAVGSDDHHMGRAGDRVLGTLAGALAGTAISFLPGPVPTVLAIFFTVLCVAFQLAKNYTMFVTFLTPAVLLLSSPESSILTLGLGRVEAILGSAAIAVVFSLLADRILRRVPSEKA